MEQAALEKTFREFAYVVSHDLGAPLRAMVEFSRLLHADQAKALDKESRLYLSMIIENGEKAQAMMAGLLEYSRLNTANDPLVPTDFNTLFSQCEMELADKIAACEATVTTQALPTVEADTVQMKRLLLVLLENALTFRAPGSGPRIFISAEKQGKDWLFAVRDNGIGIDPKFHDRIFQPFRRLHPDGEYPGIGMGLAIARKIIDRHKGRLWVESSPGQGSAFLFSIPERNIG